MKHSHLPPVPTRLLYVGLSALALASFVTAACGDNEADVTQPVGGAGGGGTGAGNDIGGFGLGPSGPGVGGGGQGGEGNQGGVGTPTFEWDSVYGDTEPNNQVNPKDVAVDAMGNIVVVGSFTGTVDLGGGAGNELTAAGGDDVFVAKYTSAGAHVWSLRAGDNADQAAQSVATDASGNIWIVGAVKGTFGFPGGPNSITNGGQQFPNAWVAKLDSTGGHQFSASYGQNPNTTDQGRAIAVGPSGQAVFAGTFQETITFDTTHAATNGSYSMFLVRYDSAHNITLERTFGDGSRQDAYAVAVGVDGAMAIGGSTEGNIDFGGGEIVHGGSGRRAVVGKLDAAGNQVFAKLFESGGPAEISDVAIHSNGDLFVTGNFAQTIDLGSGTLTATGGAKEIFVGRFDANGAVVYARRLGGVGIDNPEGIAVDSNGFATVAGSFTDDMAVNAETTLIWDSTLRDAFVVRLGPPGQGYWGYQTSALNDAYATAVAIDPASDAIVVVGTYSDQLDLGSGPVGAGHASGMFIAKYGPGE